MPSLPGGSLETEHGLPPQNVEGFHEGGTWRGENQMVLELLTKTSTARGRKIALLRLRRGDMFLDPKVNEL